MSVGEKKVSRSSTNWHPIVMAYLKPFICCHRCYSCFLQCLLHVWSQERCADSRPATGAMELLEGRRVQDAAELQDGPIKLWYRLGREWAESSPAEKNLEVLVDKKLTMSQHSQCILGCIQRSGASWAREVILPLYSCENLFGLLYPGPGCSA